MACAAFLSGEGGEQSQLEHGPIMFGTNLARDFKADAPNTKSVTDITYIQTAEGWLYLAAAMDLCSGRVAVGR